MSFWGGMRWDQTPNSQGYIDPVFNFQPGSSRGANLANQYLKATKKGMDIGQYGFLNPIRDYGAAQMRDAENQSQAQGIELGDQPVLRARLEALQKGRIGEATGRAEGAALAQQLPGWMNLSEQSTGRKDQEKLQALIAAMQGNQASWKQNYQPGLFSKISGIAGLAGQLGGLAMGMPGFGGGGGGQGSYGGFGDSAWST